MRFIDLHTHSRASDGTSSPAKMVDEAIFRKVELMSLTDHDTVDGCTEAVAAASAKGLPFICGVEISTSAHDHLHILGYGVDIADKSLGVFLERYKQKRVERVHSIITKLVREGVEITFDEVAAIARGSMSRAHVADILYSKKFASTRQDAFRRYLVPGAPGYVPPVGPPVEQAIAIIKTAGGVPVLAHPGIIKQQWSFPEWVQMGLAGVEVFYPAHSSTITGELMDIADKYNLIVTAGSDYHGPHSGREKNIGIAIPDNSFVEIKNALF